MRKQIILAMDNYGKFYENFDGMPLGKFKGQNIDDLLEQGYTIVHLAPMRGETQMFLIVLAIPE